MPPSIGTSYLFSPVINPKLNHSLSTTSATNAISLNENIERAVASMHDPSLPLVIRTADLYFINFSPRAGDPLPIDISYQWEILLMYRARREGHSRIEDRIWTSNQQGWDVWTRPKIEHSAPRLGEYYTGIQWGEIQALMPLEEADRRRRAAGFNQPVGQIVINHVGPQRDQMVLGYTFFLALSREVRINILTGEVEVLY